MVRISFALQKEMDKMRVYTAYGERENDRDRETEEEGKRQRERDMKIKALYSILSRRM